MKRTPMTLRGAEALRAELKRLKSEARPNVIKAIAEARGARRSVRERRVPRRARAAGLHRRAHRRDRGEARPRPRSSIPARLAATTKVVFGATVELEDQDGGNVLKYQIVGEDEADIRAGRISITSPIARALVGKEQGDMVDVDAPGGTHSYEIVCRPLRIGLGVGQFGRNWRASGASRSELAKLSCSSGPCSCEP